MRLLVDDGHRQAVMDALQNSLGMHEGARIVILPVEATLSPLEVTDKEKETASATGVTREELYHSVSKNAELNSNYLLLVFLSTIVAAIGLIEDNVAVVVGAMVIAPLLGPNIALALAAALGDKPLMATALKTNFAGLTLALGLSLIIGLILPIDFTSHELMSRTYVGIGSVVLALASGAAAVLSLTTGLSSVLVGVMVAVAIMPPMATVGLMLGSGQVGLAFGAALLVAAGGEYRLRQSGGQGSLSGKGGQTPHLAWKTGSKTVDDHLHGDLDHLAAGAVDSDLSTQPVRKPLLRQITSRQPAPNHPAPPQSAHRRDRRESLWRSPWSAPQPTVFGLGCVQCCELPI